MKCIFIYNEICGNLFQLGDKGMLKSPTLNVQILNSVLMWNYHQCQDLINLRSKLRIALETSMQEVCKCNDLSKKKAPIFRD